MQQNIVIQSYNGVKDRNGSETYVHIVIELIKGSDPLANQIKAIRAILRDIERLKHIVEDVNPGNWEQQLKESTERYESLKKKLPAVTWSGTFSTRKAGNLNKYSDLIPLDIDRLPPDKLQQIKGRLKSDPYTFLCFVSPSGNGLKVIVRVAGGPNAHGDNFLALEKYFQAEYNIAIDPSGKDVSRLCFLSWDPDCIVNWGSKEFDHTLYKPPAQTTVVPLTRAEEKKFVQADNDLEWIKGFTDKKMTYAEGSRNNYIHLFACNCNRKGIDINDCLNYVLSFATDLKQPEVVSTIKSAYDHNAHEAGKYAKRQAAGRPAKNIAAKPGISDNGVPAAAGSPDQPPPEEENFIKFWWITEDEKRTDEEGKPLKRYNLKYNYLIEFLEAAGFYRLRLGNGTYQFIRHKDNVCEPVNLIQIKDYVFGWLREKNYYGVLEMMRRGAKSYFIPQIMEGLEYKVVEFGRDTSTEAFFYFKNRIARVTQYGIETMPYTESLRAIWGSSMIQRDFTKVDLHLPMTAEQEIPEETLLRIFEKCEMARYILLVSHSPNNTEEISQAETTDRFLSICSSVGYMLHGYKTRTGKAIVAVDHKIPEDKTEQNGGTGKSIVGDSFKHLKSTTIIDGREFKEDYPFRFETVGVDTKVIVMKDCRYNLDFGSFFVPITDDFTYNRRHTGYVTLKFEDSPKWWFDTNFVFKGDGASFRRRMHVIEFDDYFNENHTPYEEFGHYLFNDWDEEQWNLFYNFYLYCVQLYLLRGLIDYPKSNYENRKLIAETPQEFIDFIDSTNEDGTYKHKRNEWFEKITLLKDWNNQAKELNLQTISAHLLTKYMKKYCHARPARLYKDKTNGVEWWLLADANYKGSGKKSEKKEVPMPSLFNNQNPF